MYVTQFNKANKVNIPFSSELKYLASFEKLTSLTLFFKLHVKTPSSLKIFAYNLFLYFFFRNFTYFITISYLSYAIHIFIFLQKFYAIMTIFDSLPGKKYYNMKNDLRPKNMNNNNNFIHETKNWQKG